MDGASASTDHTATSGPHFASRSEAEDAVRQLSERYPAVPSAFTPTGAWSSRNVGHLLGAALLWMLTGGMAGILVTWLTIKGMILLMALFEHIDGHLLYKFLLVACLFLFGTACSYGAAFFAGASVFCMIAD